MLFVEALRALMRAHKPTLDTDPYFAEPIHPLFDAAYSQNVNPTATNTTTTGVTLEEALQVLRDVEKPVPIEDPLYGELIQPLLDLAYAGHAGLIVLGEARGGARQLDVVLSYKGPMLQHNIRAVLSVIDVRTCEEQKQKLEDLDLGVQIISFGPGSYLVIWGQ
jgi:hypothetical protein